MSKKILIIEDDEGMVKLLAMVLQKSGYEVEVAFDALMGTKYAFEKKPNLMILDLMLPAGGGFWVLEKVKASAQTWHIPVVIYSAFSNEEYKKKAKEKGAEAYFDKTCDVKDLLTEIKKIFSME